MLSVLVSSSLPLWGQAGTGSVQGTVRDASNAVIPAVAMTLTNTATNVVIRTTTTNTGFYMFPGVVPGAYRLTAEAQGMRKFEGGLTLQTEQRAVIDVVLQVGDVATAVTVQDVTPLVTNDNPTLGHVLERDRIEQLPIGSHNPSQFIATVPGVQSENYGRAYGMRTGAIDTLIDGASTVGRQFGDWQAPIRIDAVQEMVVETNNSSAKFSRPVNMVISSKGGTNSFHGSLVETHQNSSLGAARQRQEYWSKAPQQINNQFAASAGGPVFLPGIYDGRNRTFWFINYDGARLVSPHTQGYAVPTEAMRQGDFSGLVDGQGRHITLYDPWTTDTRTWARQPFSYGGRLNVIDPARLSPVAKYLFSITPLPTEPNVNPLVAPNLWTQVPIWNNQDRTTVRFDHQFSSNDRVFVRYTWGGQYWIASATGTSVAAFITEPNIGRNVNRTSQPNLAISHTHVFSPTLFNELLITGAIRPSRRQVGAAENFDAQLGLPNPFSMAQFPSIGQTGLTATDVPSGMTQLQNEGNVKLSDNATKIYGKHELQFGGSLRYEQLNNLPNTNGKAGGLTFNTLATALYDPKSSKVNPQSVPQTGSNLANLFLGVSNYSATFSRNTNYLRDREYALYLQDNYKVTPRLTLNLGLRWEYFTEYTERDHNWVTLDRDRKAVVLGADLDQFYRMGNSLPPIVNRFQQLGVNFIPWDEAGMPQSLMDPNSRNFGPRLGFAWRMGPDKRAAVLRGGFRISYTSMPLAIWINPVQNNLPMRANYSNAALTNAAQSPDGVGSYGMRSVPTMIAGLNSSNAINLADTSAITRGSAGMVYFNRNQPDMQVRDWNLTLEKEILPNMVARAAYIGNHGANLSSMTYFNQNPTAYVWYATTGLPTPTGEYANVARRSWDQQVYGDIREYGHMGWSNYQGMQLELERRYSRGIGFQIFYNLNNVLSTLGDQSETAAAATIYDLNQYLPGIVPTDPNERNRFLNYQRDPSFPKHSVNWNWIADLPFGKGKPIAGNARGLLDKVIGGWQIAGLGSLNSNYFSLPANIYPTGEKIEIYGYKYPIQDCRSGVCQPGYLWWNGYIPPQQINSVDAKGRPNGVMGVPANYKPAGQPLIPWPQTPVPNDPMAPYYGTNTVWLPMKNGTQQRTSYDPGLHPWQNQYFPGVRQWGLDASLFKRFQITESVFVRLNATFLNVLNHPGNPNAIGGDGVLDTQISGQGARRLQLTLRLTW